MANFGSRLPRLAGLQQISFLIIIIIVSSALTTALQSELPALHSLQSSLLSSPLIVQANSNRIQTRSSRVNADLSRLESAGARIEKFAAPVVFGSFVVDEVMQQNQLSRQPFVPDRNNAADKPISLTKNNNQKQRWQPTDELLSLSSSSSKANDQPNQYPLANMVNTGQAGSFDPSHHMMITTVAPVTTEATSSSTIETNFGVNSADRTKQLKTTGSILTADGGVEQILQQVGGGPSSLMGQAMDGSESESNKENYAGQAMATTTAAKDQMLERRFGLFKKGQSNNNNNNNLFYAAAGPGTVPYYNECERCLPNLGYNTQSTSSTWQLAEPTNYGQPLIHYQHHQQQPSLASHNVLPSQTYHFATPFKTKLNNKFHLLKPTALRDSYFGQNYHYLSQKYRMPVASRSPYRAQPLNQAAFNCIQPTLMGANNLPPSPIVSPALSNQLSIEEAKDPQQMSY